MVIADYLKKFMLLPAPSGYEKEMAYGLKDAIAPFTDEVKIDRVGNVIACIRGTDSTSPKVMVFAHIDQLGFIVRKIEPNGFIQLDRLGGIPEKVLPGLKLLIRSEDGKFHTAVIGTKSHHATPAEEKYKVDPITSLYVDVGASSDKQVHDMHIETGCPAIYMPAFEQLHGSTVSGTAIDNRGGCACLIRIAELLNKDRPKSDVYLVGTVWEEFNLRGAIIAARTIKPDIAICLDVVLSGDTPDLAGKFDTRLGAGPAVSLYNFHGRGTLNGTIPHEGLVKLAISSAEELQIPLQRFATLGILTDSSYLQLEESGIAAIDLGFPARYTHTPVEVCCIEDLERLAFLAAAMSRKIDSRFSLNRY